MKLELCTNKQQFIFNDVYFIADLIFYCVLKFRGGVTRRCGLRRIYTGNRNCPTIKTDIKSTLESQNNVTK